MAQRITQRMMQVTPPRSPPVQVPNDQLIMPPKAKTLIHDTIASVREDEVTQMVARTAWGLL